jgi:CHAT domain-containing protein
MSAIAALAPGERYAAHGGEATTAKLQEWLPRVRYAHFATHGQFKADDLTAEKQRAAQALESRLKGDASRKVAAKNPLGYVGLVLANGEVLSGLSIVDLPLENVKLVTLSACETGLGEYTGGEGVQGLQLAFHLAGCPNVVASLWQVDDEATAALMAQFYHELWVEKRPPIEALRAAQLTVYRHPERIPALARDRGPNFTKTAKLSIAVAPAEANPKGKRTDVRQWAAFVLSGVGR